MYDRGNTKPALCDSLEGWDGVGEEVQEGGDVSVLTADSLCRMEEDNTIL